MSQQRAFTLIELVLTIGLLGLIGLPSGLLIAEQLHLSAASDASTVGLQLARAELERLDALNDFFASPDLSLGTRSSSPGGFPGYVVEVSVSCAVGDCTNPALNRQGIKRVEVRVRKGGSARFLAQLVTYRTKHVLFGQ